jgi:hypothetical protein
MLTRVVFPAIACGLRARFFSAGGVASRQKRESNNAILRSIAEESWAGRGRENKTGMILALPHYKKAGAMLALAKGVGFGKESRHEKLLKALGPTLRLS